jgi:adenosylcobinamide-GDP ribazoletransferase
MPDSLRLAIGTLTVWHAGAPTRVDRGVARHAMLLAPLVGLLLVAVPAVVVLDAVRWLAPAEGRATVVDLLGVVLALVTTTWLTRALHLDGLADTADGLGVKGEDDTAAARRLAVMRAPDVGAFGVAAIVLDLLVQVVALTACVVAGYGTVSLLAAVTVGRLAATWACTTGVSSARPDGLGAAVAGSVPRRAAAALTLGVLVLAAALGSLDDDRSVRVSVTLVVAALVALGLSTLVLRRCVRRFGGVTGDVLGAVVEVATSVVLVVVALAV